MSAVFITAWVMRRNICFLEMLRYNLLVVVRASQLYFCHMCPQVKQACFPQSMAFLAWMHGSLHEDARQDNKHVHAEHVSMSVDSCCTLKQPLLQTSP